MEFDVNTHEITFKRGELLTICFPYSSKIKHAVYIRSVKTSTREKYYHMFFDGLISSQLLFPDEINEVPEYKHLFLVDEKLVLIDNYILRFSIEKSLGIASLPDLKIKTENK